MDATATPPEKDPQDPFWGSPPFSEDAAPLTSSPGCTCDHRTTEDLVACILARWDRRGLPEGS
jgi:hypothetical protein